MLPVPAYHSTDLVRRVRPDGYFSLSGRTIGLSQAFAGLDIALRPTQRDGVLTLHFMRFTLGVIDTTQPNPVVKTVRDVSEQPSTISPV